MDTCQICKHDFSRLRFKTERIKICTRCVNTLNEFNEPASHAQGRVREMLARGMEKNALRDVESDEDWKRNKASWTLKHFEVSVDQALSGWITKLLADDKNSTKDFKMLRAERRGLLRMDGGDPYDYPKNWREVASRIRALDRQCADCGDTVFIQDVHHIIYLSRHGTNRQENLVRLCRPCHQKLHGFEFDPPESFDTESLAPIQFPKAGSSHPAPGPVIPSPPISPPDKSKQEAPAPRQVPLPPPPLELEPQRFDTQCTWCHRKLTTASYLITGQNVRCPSCEKIFRHDVPVESPVEETHQKSPIPPMHNPRSTTWVKQPSENTAKNEVELTVARTAQQNAEMSRPLFLSGYEGIPTLPKRSDSPYSRADIVFVGLLVSFAVLVIILLI